MPGLLNPDGSLRIHRKGLPSDLRADLFHTAVRGSWVRLLGAFLLVYLLAAAVFTALYGLRPGCLAGVAEGDWMATFFYSSLALSGAGHEVVHPATPYGHAVLVAESLLGLFGFALFTGLFFSRFARPRARLRFSPRILRSTWGGRPALIFRMANERDVPIIDARAELWLVRTETTPEGVLVRRPVSLPLGTDRIAVLVLSWTVVHFLDTEDSVDEEELAAMLGGPADLYLMVTGLDGVTGAPVHLYQDYDAKDVHDGGRFRQMVEFHPDGSRSIDYGLLDAVEPIPASDPEGVDAPPSDPGSAASENPASP